MSDPATFVRASSRPTPYLVSFANEQGHVWTADEPAALGGGNTAPSPEHLLLASLGACTAITLQMYAARKQWALSGVDVELRLNPEGKPAAGTSQISRLVTLRGELDDTQRSRLMQIADACPMHKVLTGTVQVTTTATE